MPRASTRTLTPRKAASGTSAHTAVATASTAQKKIEAPPGARVTCVTATHATVPLASNTSSHLSARCRPGSA